ncbi:MULTISPECIES: STAS domain-containing protein [Streptosporangium]|uniref:Anti-sigma factor antagonist n=1 Tax=Streptosporangium brasiliense TaxID=47480 RepID=A0ABT9R8X2_9ACTN|nr:STAS domain-containing protein [Streptosporangium brasiliense]MDP9865678.1 anti-anti-sigma factor [Streptosporangium brasiliense]
MSRDLVIHVTHHEEAGCAVLTVEGDIDRNTSPLLREAVRGLVSGGNVRIVLDVAEITFCDSNGLRTFLSGMALTFDAGGWLRLAGAQGHFERLLRMTDLYSFFSIDADVVGSLKYASDGGPQASG